MPLRTELASGCTYDFIVCGAGSSGCVVARRLAESGAARVLLVEAGGSDDDDAAIFDPTAWTQNIGGDRDWGFTAEPNAALGGRVLPLSMGKVLGGGSSINGLMWVRGHREDWDGFAAETGDPSWGYDHVRRIYERIENRGRSSEPCGPVHLESANPSDAAPLLVEAAASLGIPVFDHPNGRMMELKAGAATMEVTVSDGTRRSMYRAYVHPILEQDNLDVLTNATVVRLKINRGRVEGIELSLGGALVTVGARIEVVVSLGAINTPKLLFQSGIGEETELRRFGIAVERHLPGVGRNFQDHVMLFGVAWEIAESVNAPNASRAVVQHTSSEGLDRPDIQILQSNGGTIRAEMRDRRLPPHEWWSLAPGLVRPLSRGRLRFTGDKPSDRVLIDANHLTDPTDRTAMIAAVELCRELGATKALCPWVKRELLPGSEHAADLMRFVRDRTVTYWHQSCTAKMGRDELSVVDATLKVYGLDNLRVADASVLPNITTGNTMAPSVIIGERAAEMLRTVHGI